VDKGFLQLRTTPRHRNPKRRKDFVDFVRRQLFQTVMGVTFLSKKYFKKFWNFPKNRLPKLFRNKKFTSVSTTSVSSR
jgi:hypothetical protein